MTLFPMVKSVSMWAYPFWGKGYVVEADPSHNQKGARSPTAKIHRSRNLGVETRVAPLRIAPSDPIATLLVLLTLCPADLVLSKGCLSKY